MTLTAHSFTVFSNYAADKHIGYANVAKLSKHLATRQQTAGLAAHVRCVCRFPCRCRLPHLRWRAECGAGAPGAAAPDAHLGRGHRSRLLRSVRCCRGHGHTSATPTGQSVRVQLQPPPPPPPPAAAVQRGRRTGGRPPPPAPTPPRVQDSCLQHPSGRQQPSGHGHGAPPA